MSARAIHNLDDTTRESSAGKRSRRPRFWGLAVFAIVAGGVVSLPGLETHRSRRHAVDRGEEIFFGSRANCAVCHRVGGRGGDVGPDLSLIGDKLDRYGILEAIVMPSAKIAPNFETYTIVTREGKVHTGVIRRQTAESVLVTSKQSDADPVETAVSRDEIDVMQMGATSLMPSGYGTLLSREELLDLVEFVASCQ